MLILSDVWVSYPDRSHVLHDLSVHIQEGEKVGLIGDNGCGKTTLFLTICGILKHTQGTILLQGTPVVHGTFRPEIGVVFQNPADQIFCPSVRDDIAFGPINMGLSNEEVEARVREALDATGIAHLRNRAPHHLSGGEKRMVAIAGVMAMNPRVILYDEPDAYLDQRARRRLIDFLQTSRQTLLIASHDTDIIQQVCQRVVEMKAGTIVANGTPVEDRLQFSLAGK
jgi:cobalt/nickel transport system ATP-binding protein